MTGPHVLSELESRKDEGMSFDVQLSFTTHGRSDYVLHRNHAAAHALSRAPADARSKKSSLKKIVIKRIRYGNA